MLQSQTEQDSDIAVNHKNHGPEQNITYGTYIDASKFQALYV